MRSIERAVHVKGRSALHTATDDGAHLLQTAVSAPSSPLPTPRIQMATISQSQQFTVPAATTSSLSSPTISATVAPMQEHTRLSSESIAGLAMIPVIIILVAAAIFTYFWLQNRRKRKPVIRHLGPSPPPVPEKDIGSPASSFDSMASNGKVCSITAMNASAMHKGWHASPRPQAQNDSAVHHNPWNDQLPKISADITTAEFLTCGAIGDGNDSPIDRSSPFRLKRGDTKKRSSLDPRVMGAWPLPPQPTLPQPARTQRTYMERRSISAEYFAQEKLNRDVDGMQEYWEDIRLELGPDLGPTVKP